MNHSKKITRRGLLKNGVLTASSLGAGGWAWSRAQANPMGANNRIRVGVIGVGVRGKYLIGNLPDAVQVTAICDCATSRIGSALEPKVAPIMERAIEIAPTPRTAMTRTGDEVMNPTSPS